MELKLLLGFVVSMLGSLFGKMLAPDRVPSAKVAESVKPLVVADRKVSCSELKVASFVTNVLDGHFAGVSVPCNSISEARNSAIADVVFQVLSSVSIEYNFDIRIGFLAIQM